MLVLVDLPLVLLFLREDQVVLAALVTPQTTEGVLLVQTFEVLTYPAVGEVEELVVDFQSAWVGRDQLSEVFITANVGVLVLAHYPHRQVLLLPTSPLGRHLHLILILDPPIVPDDIFEEVTYEDLILSA